MKDKQKVHEIDATNKSLGRLATEVARLLIGKHKPDYLPHKDLGETVIVKNIDKLKISFKKLRQKKYYHHSGYPGGLKIETLEKLFLKSPAEVLRRAVYNMLPKNKLRKERIKKLLIKYGQKVIKS
ncbi:MAG: 50S ribosomal protein L13 [Patescibacteria group bacterium]